MIFFFHFFQILGKIIPIKFLPFFGAILGKISFIILKSKRNLIYENLKLSFPNWEEEKIKRCTLENFKHYGLTFFELFKIKNLIERVEIEGLENLDQKPCIFITAHLGNWELLAQVLAKNNVPLYAIAKETYISNFNRFLINLRKKGKIETILRGSKESAKLMLKCIKEKKVLGFLIDQDTKVESVFVPFFGRLASTPSGPAELAIKKSLPICFGYIVRKKNLKYSIKIKKLEFQSNDVGKITSKMTKEIEIAIRKNPTQWVWVHKRWKTRPSN